MTLASLIWLGRILPILSALVLPFWKRLHAGTLVADLSGLARRRLVGIGGAAFLALVLARLLLVNWDLGPVPAVTLGLAFAGVRGETITWRVSTDQKAVIDQLLHEHLSAPAELAG